MRYDEEMEVGDQRGTCERPCSVVRERNRNEFARMKWRKRNEKRKKETMGEDNVTAQLK